MNTKQRRLTPLICLNTKQRRLTPLICLGLIFSLWAQSDPTASLLLSSQESQSTSNDDVDPLASQLNDEFQATIQPLLQKYCVECHNAEDRESGIQVDHLDAQFLTATLGLWQAIQRDVHAAKMPPEDSVQPTAEERQTLESFIDRGIQRARSRPDERNGSIRRLTVAQYRNTLRDLLQMDEDLTDILPPDAVSKEGFTNDSDTLQLSPLALEAYFSIAEQALDRVLVDESVPPTIEHFRMEIGQGINTQPCPDHLILGAESLLLANGDFVVTEPKLEKPFPFVPFQMQRKFRFIEGYQGNDTVRDWRDYDSIYHAVFACMRGTNGYPKGRAFETIPSGLLLRPAIPSPEIFGQSSTYGPQANFKISLRELPEEGRFRITVRAAKSQDGLLIDKTNIVDSKAALAEPTVTLTELREATPQRFEIAEAGIYLVSAELDFGSSETPDTFPAGNELQLSVDQQHVTATLRQPEFVALRLASGEHQLTAQVVGTHSLKSLVFRRIEPSDPWALRFDAFQQRAPRVGVHLGLRRDCGSTLAPVGSPQTVDSSELTEYVFEGAINDFPRPEVEKDNVNYLAGVREIGIRSEYTDGRDMPRLLVRSIDFEGPLYDSWPPESHRLIFFESPHQANPEIYAREVISRFATRAFRRPVADSELSALIEVQQASLAGQGNFQKSVTDALLVVLTSPQFLFMIESSAGPEAEPIGEYELATKLAYFLWNAPPDETLLELAANQSLTQNLDLQIERMIAETRFSNFSQEFASQWLSLDKFDVVETDSSRFPRLTREVKAELCKEPIELLQQLIKHNHSASDLIRSDFVMVNEVVASYYGLADSVESGFDFVAVPNESEYRGGLLTLPAVLAGLSDGREANPVKRGAWFARRIVAMPPDDPPPNVPKLEDLTELSLRERLERHRNVTGCSACHQRIDPWGLPFERFDAAGLEKSGSVDDRSQLPDGTEVSDFVAFREHLMTEQLDQVAFSFAKHLAVYAAGRKLTYNETERLRESLLSLKDDGYQLQQIVRLVVHDDLFLKK